jgi:CBS domain-containing protein/gamma-glutamylcysteine synthetase
MSNQSVTSATDAESRRAYMRSLLRDVEALERMLESDMVESGVSMIGAEQELVIVDQAGRPLPIAQEIIDEVDDEHVTNELGKFNLEFNLDPLPFADNCLSELEDQINALLAKTRAAAYGADAQIALCGILPSLEKADLGIEHLTDKPRYHALNDVLMRMRGAPSRLSIEGLDELSIRHQSVMLEACNTSFQVHFQVDPADFTHCYNIAQAVTGPTLAAATNSPMLFGRRLWHETRIALFQQSVDTRVEREDLREFQPRVSFGNHWIDDGVLEIYREDIARFKPLFHDVSDEDPLALLDSGVTPRLRALCLHNGTVYRWNRACYGVSPNGKPHLRIENRVLPSGPTPADEVANAAFWFGLMHGLSDECDDMRRAMAFEDVASNFNAAARHGLDAQLVWFGGSKMPARELIALHLIPLAERGLNRAGVDAGRYLDILERRVATGKTGSVWVLGSLASMGGVGARSGRLARVTCAMIERQLHGAPVHEWEPVSESEFAGDRRHIHRVGQFMATDLFTVHDSDVVDLVTNLMDWKHVRHVPVEDDEHNLVGLVSARALLRHLGRARTNGDGRAVPVSEIMEKDPVTATPDTTTLEAIRLMREHQVSCLPVVEGSRLVGIVSEHDVMGVAAPLLERFLED